MVADPDGFRDIDQLPVLRDRVRVGAPDIHSFGEDAILTDRYGNAVPAADDLAAAAGCAGPDMDGIVISNDFDVRIVDLDVIVDNQGVAFAPQEDGGIVQVCLLEPDGVVFPEEADSGFLDDRGIREDLILLSTFEPGLDDCSFLLEPPGGVGQ